MRVNVVTNILEDVGDPFQYFSMGMSKKNQILGGLSYLSI